MRRTATVCALVVLLHACGPAAPPIVLATTTSVAHSGLLDHILSGYTAGTVRAVPVGSGRALDMLASGNADVVISHAPAREADALRTHPGWWYRKVLYNDFLIVGPPADPAAIGGMTDAVAAMKRIADTNQRFLSRGDESGTHDRERQLWAAAGITPSPERVIVAGAGMSQTLRIASATGAYTLTDRGTFDALATSVQLRVLVTGDPRLVNTYAVIADPVNERGIIFARWLAEGDGRQALARILARGEIRGFSVWPDGVDGHRPDALPR